MTSGLFGVTICRSVFKGRTAISATNNACVQITRKTTDGQARRAATKRAYHKDEALRAALADVARLEHVASRRRALDVLEVEVPRAALVLDAIEPLRRALCEQVSCKLRR